MSTTESDAREDEDEGKKEPGGQAWMTIVKPGFYKLFVAFVTRGSTCVGTLPKGTIIHITQVDHSNQQVIGPSLLDWTWSHMPVTPITKEKCRTRHHPAMTTRPWIVTPELEKEHGPWADYMAWYAWLSSQRGVSLNHNFSMFADGANVLDLIVLYELMCSLCDAKGAPR